MADQDRRFRIALELRDQLRDQPGPAVGHRERLIVTDHVDRVDVEAVAQTLEEAAIDVGGKAVPVGEVQQ
jgi:predicted nuclease with TOPRIM domain